MASTPPSSSSSSSPPSSPSSPSSSPSPSPSPSPSSSSSISCHRFSLDQIEDARNQFRESKYLGHGGEGDVYLTKVQIEGKHTWVAVKLLKKISNVLEKEIQIVPKIQHPHILSLLGYCEESGKKMLVYEYMENGSLSRYVRGGKRSLSWLQRLNICLGAARGLQHLHTPTKEFPFGIIHRDVKPGNILVDANWVGKLSDFGMFKLSYVGQKESAMKTEFKGTRGYYAPEYIASQSVTRRIDVYGFGIVLFEVLCRKMPWDRGGESYYRRDDEDLGLWAQKNIDIEIKGEISVKSFKIFTDIINRCLKRKSDERPTMDDVVLDLEKALKCQELHDEARKHRHNRFRWFLPACTREKEQTRGETAEKKNTEELIHTRGHKLVNVVVINKEEATLPICDVCDEPVEGLFYRCNHFDFVGHPLCTQYPQNIRHLLQLMHPSTFQISNT